MLGVWLRSYYIVMLAVPVWIFLAIEPHLAAHQTALLSIALVLLLIPLVHFSERIWPYRPDWNRDQGDAVSDLILTNLVLPAISQGVQILLASLFLDWAANSFAVLRALWPHDWTILTQTVLILVLAELLFYWIHRWGHSLAILWRFHSIHHAAKRVYWNNSGRFHPFDLFLNFVVYFSPLFLFGVSPQVVALFLLINGVTGLLEHANVRFEAGWLNGVFNTAQLHRWHHSTVPQISSKNFGKVLCLWDRIFGTWFCPPDRQVGEVGVESESIPPSVWAQMSYPFRSRSSR